MNAIIVLIIVTLMIASLVFHAHTLSVLCEYFTRTFTFSITLYTLHVFYTYTFYTFYLYIFLFIHFYSSLCNVYTILKFIVQNSTLNKDPCIFLYLVVGIFATNWQYRSNMFHNYLYMNA